MVCEGDVKVNAGAAGRAFWLWISCLAGDRLVGFRGADASGCWVEVNTYCVNLSAGASAWVLFPSSSESGRALGELDDRGLASLSA